MFPPVDGCSRDADVCSRRVGRTRSKVLRLPSTAPGKSSRFLLWPLSCQGENHLPGNAWSNPRETENGRDDDRDGYADDLRGWDFVAQAGGVTDPNGHGTAVAGIIAAEGDNGVGVAGVMWRASLMSLRVLDGTGAGDVAAAVEAIDYAVAHGASVVNVSWGTGGHSRSLRDAVWRAGRRGVLVVCSAGNSGRSVDSEPY